MKNFTSIQDVDNLDDWVQKALALKKQAFAHQAIGQNKSLGLIFLNPSLRTRMSSQKAALNLGMQVMVMNLSTEGWAIEFEDGTVMDQGTQEHIKEAAGVMSQYCDIIGIRTFAGLQNREEDYAEKILTHFIEYAKVPVISLESATLHPLQSFADVLTIEEHKKSTRPKVVLSWAPHVRALPQAVANSFAQWVSKREVDLVIAQPPGFELATEFSQGATITTDQKAALEGADFVYAKNWSSYQNYGQIGTTHQDWIIDKAKMKLSNNAHFMHCLPVRRNLVVSDAVLDSPNSLVLEQAHNRVFAAQTVLLKILENEG